MSDHSNEAANLTYNVENNGQITTSPYIQFGMKCHRFVQNILHVICTWIFTYVKQCMQWKINVAIFKTLSTQ